MYQTMSDKDLEEYFSTYFSTGILPLHIRPTRCERERCAEKQRFNRHGQYARKSVYRKGIGWVPCLHIQRFLYMTCGKVISLIVPICYKWQRVEHAVQQAVAMGESTQGQERAESKYVRAISYTTG
jgi:hypothetical protein